MTIRAFEGTFPSIHEQAWVDESAVVIGHVTIGEDSSIWPMTVVRGDIHTITIGQRTNIQDGSVLHVTHSSDFNPNGSPLFIGDDVTVGHKAVLHACRIGNRCLIGMNAVVLDNAVVPDEVIVGAGSVVAPGKVLESGFLYLGAPARKVRPLTEKEIQFFRYSAKHYVDLKNRHRAGG